MWFVHALCAVNLAVLLQARVTGSLPSNKHFPTPIVPWCSTSDGPAWRAVGPAASGHWTAQLLMDREGSFKSASRIFRWQTCGALCSTCTEPCCWRLFVCITRVFMQLLAELPVSI